MNAIISHFFLGMLESVAQLFLFLTGKWLLLLISGGRSTLMPPASFLRTDRSASTANLRC